MTDTAQQLLNNVVRLRMQTRLYTHDFEDWNRKIAADKYEQTSKRSSKNPKHIA
jgi:hypothetical protein